MAVYTEEDHISRVAGADLSTKQYRVVKMNSSRQVVLASAATDMSLGVLANSPVQNATADVKSRNADGTFKVVCGGTVSVNSPLTADSNGAAVAATAAGAGVVPTTHVFGYAQEAGVTGQVIEYLPAFLVI